MERRLAAILIADVVGYTRLMEADEAGTLAAIKERLVSVFDPTIRLHSGRIVKTMGDGVLVEFASAVNAVTAAVDLQQRMGEANSPLPQARQILLRIGINLGDVIGDGDDILGDGVNVAARLEALADAGTICLSGKVYAEVQGKIALEFEDLGEQQLKNIARPVRAFRLRVKHETSSPHGALSLPDNPSIAVLPFENMSGDGDHDYFADGMVEEIISALSRSRWLFVIARNSSFTYKGQAVDVKRVGRELGVRYVLQGSVRKAVNRVRIGGQLIDASTGVTLWADRFEGPLEDVFDLQDQITTKVVSAITPRLEQVEIERAKRKPTDNLGAYDYYLRGLPGLYLLTQAANGNALSHFYRAIELDPGFASSYGQAARCYAQRMVFGWFTDRAAEISETKRLATHAAEIGHDDAVALATAALGLTFVCDELEESAVLLGRALALNPNLAIAWQYSGWTKMLLGEPETAIEHVARAMRLSPNDPHVFNLQAATSCGHFFAGRDIEAATWAEMTGHEQPRHVIGALICTASNALIGRADRAAAALARLRQFAPSLRLSNLNEHFPVRRPTDLAKLVDGLRKAGLPE